MQIIHKSVNWRDPYGFIGRLGDFRETANSSSLMVSNNSRISRLETIMFPRFLKLELDRGSRTPDALEVDEAVAVLIGERLDADDRLLELATLPEKNELLEIDQDISLKTEWVKTTLNDRSEVVKIEIAKWRVHVKVQRDCDFSHSNATLKVTWAEKTMSVDKENVTRTCEIVSEA